LERSRHLYKTEVSLYSKQINACLMNESTQTTVF